MLKNRDYDRLKREAVRYLGYGRNAVDERTSALIDKGFSDLGSAANAKFICRLFDLSCMEKEKICFENLVIRSKSLGRNLAGCEQIMLFGATLGIGVDKLLARKSVTDMAEAVVLQACAAALLEEYCDECQEQIAEEVRQEGKFLRPRFSPGYGDFPIDFQKEFIRIMDCGRRIGLTITEGCMMTPTKSVTAVIGVSSEDTGCKKAGCEECDRQDCRYRRNEYCNR